MANLKDKSINKDPIKVKRNRIKVVLTTAFISGVIATVSATALYNNATDHIETNKIVAEYSSSIEEIVRDNTSRTENGKDFQYDNVEIAIASLSEMEKQNLDAHSVLYLIRNAMSTNREGNLDTVIRVFKSQLGAEFNYNGYSDYLEQNGFKDGDNIDLEKYDAVMKNYIEDYHNFNNTVKPELLGGVNK